MQVLPIVAQLVSAAGLVAYTSMMREWSFQKVILLPKLAAVLVHLMDVALFTRLNRALGVPDAYFVLGTEARLRAGRGCARGAAAGGTALGGWDSDTTTPKDTRRFCAAVCRCFRTRSRRGSGSCTAFSSLAS